MAFKLPRLRDDWQDNPHLTQRYWNEAMLNLEKVLNQLLSIPAIQQALEDLTDATAAAQAAANNANDAADATSAESSIVNSYIDSTSFTAPLIQSDNLGDVTIKTHTRVYGNGSTVSVNGTTISTGEAAGNILRFYYDDSSRAGGSVTYAYTVDPAAFPVQSGDRHSVGVVTVPATGTDGGDYLKPPGYVY